MRHVKAALDVLRLSMLMRVRDSEFLTLFAKQLFRLDHLGVSSTVRETSNSSRCICIRSELLSKLSQDTHLRHP